MAIIDIKGAVTGRQSLNTPELKTGFELGEYGTRDQIDAPNWVPTGSHELYRSMGSGWSSSVVFGEHIRAGVFA